MNPTASYDNSATAYYLPFAVGSGPVFRGCPTMLWVPQAQRGDGSFGVRNDQFGFNLTRGSDLLKMRTSPITLVRCLVLFMLQAALLPAALQAQTVQLRFLDSATGCALQPGTVTTRSHQPGAVEKRVSFWQVSKAGRTALSLEPGKHTLLAAAPNHQPMSGTVVVDGSQSYVLEFLLDPLEEPREMQADYIASLYRDDATLIQGFVVDDDTREPLSGVQVSSAPSGVQAQTDGRGFFQFYIPVQAEAEAAATPASLVFEKAGYQVQERQYLELWPKGDWTYRIRLAAGKGRQIVDERETRRRPPPDKAAPGVAQMPSDTAKALA
ncbi:MAG: hypothetical protein NT154_34705, partial [Verrucomicrobia bacterium]|nr:hypothetical protein [Verrucomicrobiota bacterium]